MKKRTYLLLASLVLAGAACSRTQTVPLPDPSDLGTGQTAIPSGSVIPPPEDAPPADGPVGGQLSDVPEVPNLPNELGGTSTTTVKGLGDESLSLNFTRMDPYSYWGGPGGATALTFMEGADSLTVGGVMDKGTSKTSNTLSLQITTGGTKPINFISGNGSCRITVVTADSAGVSGRFRCDHAKVKTGTFIDVEGTFSSATGGL